MVKSQKAVKKGDGPGLAHPVGQHLRVAVEQADELRGPQPDHQADDLRQDGGAQDAEPCSLLHPVHLPGPQVLADKGGQSHGEAGDREEGEALDPGVGAAARHGVVSEGVDVALNDDVGQADDGVLDTGGQAEANDLLEGVLFDPQAPDLDLVDLAGSEEAAQNQYHGDHLGDHRGRGGGAHPPVEHRHEQQVQRHVDGGGCDQVIQRPAAVPHRLEHAGGDIVDKHRCAAVKVGAEVVDGAGQHVLRRSHPPQDLGGEDHADDGEDHPGDEAEGQGRVDGGPQPVIAFCPVEPGDQHTGAHGHAVEEAGEHENQVAGGADGGQGLLADEVADDEGVGGVVELLEEVA